MPKKLEEKRVASQLKKEAAEKGLTGDQKNAYVYGAMRKTGWVRGTDKFTTTKRIVNPGNPTKK